LRPAAEEEENPKGRGSVLLARKSGELCGGWFGPRKREIEKCMGAAVIWFRGVSDSVGEDKILNRGGGGGSREKEGFRVRYFLYFFLMLSKLPPLKNQCSLVFIGNVLLGFQTSPSTFSFLLFSSFFL